MKTKKPLGPLLLVLAVCIIAVIAHASMKTNFVIVYFGYDIGAI